MKCHLYTYRFSHLANIFSRSRQFDDKCIAGLRMNNTLSAETQELIVKRNELEKGDC